MKTLLFSLILLLGVSFGSNADQNSIIVFDQINQNLIAYGWADGVDCDMYAYGVYLGFLAANPNNENGALETHFNAYIDCMAGGGRSRIFSGL